MNKRNETKTLEKAMRLSITNSEITPYVILNSKVRNVYL